MAEVKPCSVEDCPDPVSAKGYCRNHYNRWYHSGSPIDVRPTQADRFWAKVGVETETGCWPWLGFIKLTGYGQFLFDSQQMNAHRAAYLMLVGPIPEGSVIDHLCRNRICVNPVHLEAVTQRENCIRGEGFAKKARQTHCKRGHPLSGDNLYVSKKGHRSCVTCRWLYKRGLL